MLKGLKEVKKTFLWKKTISSDFHIEIDKASGGYSIVASGVRRISELSDERVRLSCREVSATVSGKELSLTLYENKTVEISGRIECVELSYAKN